MLFASKCTVLLNVGETKLLRTLLCGAQIMLNTDVGPLFKTGSYLSVGVELSPFTSISREIIVSSQTFFSQIFCSPSVEEKKIYIYKFTLVLAGCGGTHR